PVRAEGEGGGERPRPRRRERDHVALGAHDGGRREGHVERPTREAKGAARGVRQRSEALWIRSRVGPLVAARLAGEVLPSGGPGAQTEAGRVATLDERRQEDVGRPADALPRDVNRKRV